MARLDPLRRAIARSPTEIQTARPGPSKQAGLLSEISPCTYFSIKIL